MVWTAIKLPCASLRLPTFWASSTGKLLSQRCGEIYVRSRTKWLAGTLMTLGVVSSLFIGGRVGVIAAALCFTAGLGYLGSQFHFKIKAKQLPTSKQGQTLLEPDVEREEPTDILVTVKAAYAYSPDVGPDNGD